MSINLYSKNKLSGCIPRKSRAVVGQQITVKTVQAKGLSTYSTFSSNIPTIIGLLLN